MLTRLAHVDRPTPLGGDRRWLVLTVFGGFAAGQVSTRWYQSFSIPG